MNNCTFIGRLARDVELRRTQTGKAVCSFTLAVDRPHSKDTTDFIDFVVWNQGAEYLSKYANKGDKVSVIGALSSRKWEDKNGNNRISWEIICDTVSIESSKNSNTAGTVDNSAANYTNTAAPVSDFAVLEGDDDASLPF